MTNTIGKIFRREVGFLVKVDGSIISNKLPRLTHGEGKNISSISTF
jgi:hypothetical protein